MPARRGGRFLFCGRTRVFCFAKNFCGRGAPRKVYVPLCGALSIIDKRGGKMVKSKGEQKRVRAPRRVRRGGNMQHFKLPAGVRDVLPEQSGALDAAEQLLRKKFAEAGFRTVRAAGLEYYDTLTKIGSAVDQAQMFKMTDRDGNLIVLRPDMTLACARIEATKLHGAPSRLCYFSDIYDFSAGGNSDREVAQAGVEIFGEEGARADADAVAFAVECCKALGLKDFIIDIGHVGFYKGLLEESGLSAEESEQLRAYINAKDAVNTEMALRRTGAPARVQAAILALPSLFGGAEVLAEAEKLTDNPLARASLAHLQAVYACLKERGAEKYVSFDLGTVKSLAYYSGIVFTGLAEGVGAPVLSGGRYDGLCAQYGADVPAVGFAVGMMRAMQACGSAARRTGGRGAVNVALAKGRLASSCADLLCKCGVPAGILKEETRKLVLETPDGAFRFFFVKPSDVPTYVEYGVADIGIVGKDTLLEAEADLYEMLDLGFERCKLCLAGFPGTAIEGAAHLRIASKYARTAKKLFASRGSAAEVIELHGSIELAPLTGLSDVIFDIVQSGATLRANGLTVLEEVFDISARLVANKVSLKTKAAQILPLIAEMKKYIEG